LIAQFPKRAAAEFEVKRVTVNGAAQTDSSVENRGVFNGHRVCMGWKISPWSVFANWQPGKSYELVVEGATDSGQAVRLSVKQDAPTERAPVKSTSFGSPTVEIPYHHIAVVLRRKSIGPGKVTLVELDGKKSRDVRFFNSGKPHPAKSLKPARWKGKATKAGWTERAISGSW